MGKKTGGIVSQYKEHAGAFLKGVKKSGSTDESRIHKLRVEIKNLRSFAALLKVITQGDYSDKAIARLLKPAFKKAGKIRTSQLNMKLTDEFFARQLSGFKKHLTEKKKKAEKKFRNELGKFDKKRFDSLYRDSLKSYGKLKKGEIRNNTLDYLRSLFAAVRKEVYDVSDDQALHEIRKKVRVIKTIGKLLDKSGIEHPFGRELDNAEKIYDEIGYWHDLLVLTAELEKFAEKTGNAALKSKTGALIPGVKKKSQRSRSKIVKKLKSGII